MAGGLVRVLVVDDSAFVRKVVKQMLTRSPFIEVVGTARDGAEALELARELKPDVVTLDLMMPVMDGVEFLRRQMAIRPIPVVVCSITHETGAAALEAFEAGAVDFIQKPTALATDRIHEMADDLIAKVKAASTVVLAQPVPPRPAPAPARQAATAKKGGRLSAEIVVIGISTGGPQALRYLIPKFPADFPLPVAMVLHMPVGYTEMYAQRLNELSALTVTEAREGDLVQPGSVLLAPAGRHLLFARRDDQLVHAHLDLRPVDTQHRPAVDVLFRSAADVYDGKVLGVVMTGMGNDGVAGSLHIRSKGGMIVTEAESSCVVYGMPRAVVEAGASDRSATLDNMMTTILEMM
ncbi:MAG TPA: chemotaxis response regulator protein-glutamate methylesterase [Gemmatimonadaceae bacterium]|nr:chemotaxis response regulator protein-glutamate methylesterase [Gemmatimonadaceae bacterium]